jgi:ferritin
MKLIFFLIAFCLVFLRLFLFWTGHDRQGNDGNITITGNGFIEQMKWSGQVRFNEEETAIRSITPGGYIKYRRNEDKLYAESNLQGEVKYELYQGRTLLKMDEQGRKFISEVVKEMIDFGLDAPQRMDRIYRQDGIPGLIRELGKMKFDYTKELYLNRIFSSDSLTQEEWLNLANRIDSLGSDMLKAKFLKNFRPAQLHDSLVNRAYYSDIAHMNGEMEKENVIQHLIEQGPMTDGDYQRTLDLIDQFGSDMEKENLLRQLMNKRDITNDRSAAFLNLIRHVNSDMQKENLLRQLMDEGIVKEDHLDELLEDISHIGSDMEKANLLRQLIKKDSITGSHFDKLLDLIGRMGSDMDKGNLYQKLIEEKNMSEKEWEDIIEKISLVGSDMDKSNLLVSVARKMPQSEELKAIFLKSARTIHSDPDFGRVMRAMD